MGQVREGLIRFFLAVLFGVSCTLIVLGALALGSLIRAAVDGTI